MDNRTIEEVRKNETKLIEEIKSLEKQLEYLRSGEYYNQLRFENEMLQQVVDTNGVPSEVYNYIDCTHRNIELLEENQELKKQLHEASIQIQEMIEQDIECPSNCSKLKELKKQLEEKENIACNWKDSCLENAGKIEKLENQQKKFISYLESEIYSIEPKGTGINYNCEYDSEEDYINAMEEQSKLNTFKQILSKYKSIIGGKE